MTIKIAKSIECLDLGIGSQRIFYISEESGWRD